MAVAGWMSRQQQEVIAYLREENKILREKFGRKRILLSIEQKRRLATSQLSCEYRGPVQLFVHYFQAHSIIS